MLVQIEYKNWPIEYEEKESKNCEGIGWRRLRCGERENR